MSATEPAAADVRSPLPTDTPHAAAHAVLAEAFRQALELVEAAIADTRAAVPTFDAGHWLVMTQDQVAACSRVVDRDRQIARYRHRPEVIASFIDAALDRARGRRRYLVVYLPGWMWARYREVRQKADLTASGVTVHTLHGEVDHVTIDSKDGETLSQVYLPPTGLTGLKAEVYATLRADGLDLIAATDAALAI
jgi:hypothetical protein